MTIDQQRDVLDKTYKMLTEFCGKPPKGSVAPWWETSREGAELLLSYGIEYDHSMSHEDCQMYWLRTGMTSTLSSFRESSANEAMHRRLVDQNRLYQESRRMDETASQR
jgi:hypothetical protein